ncbi:MAG: hypothetical protein HZA91_15990 [Verrucomicrobia bacterium]|nr:hypothetical protein [Verrucomicrobiota bacterium]
MINHWLGLPPNASAQGPELDHMLELVHWLVVALFIGWLLFFFYSIFRFRSSRHPKASPSGVHSHFYSYSEVAVVVMEAVLLLVFAFPLWAKRVNQFPPSQDATVVRVIAEQFAWNIHYGGADGVFGRAELKLVSSANPLGIDTKDPHAKDDVITLNQMHVPVSKPVIVYVSSKDVIHSFKVPLMRVMQDAIPGTVVPVWFTPTQCGSYEIVCAQLCGLGHYRMRGFLVVQSQQDYDAWMKQQASRGTGGATSYE